MFVLNVDDDEEDGSIFMEAVKEIDSQINCVFISKAEDAIELLSANTGILPDYIFLDINMPHMDGRECLVALRRIPSLNSVKIVMFSTSIPENEARTYRALNATCLKKPSDFRSLKASLKQILIR